MVSPYTLPVYCIKAHASYEQLDLFKMYVICNAFTQICSSGNCKWHNDIAFSVSMPHAVLFDGKPYVCNWQRTIGEDGQWNEVMFAFSRLGNRDMNQLSTEQYSRISDEYWILKSKTPTAPTMRVLNVWETQNGVFCEIPFKLLRLRSSTLTIPSPRHGKPLYAQQDPTLQSSETIPPRPLTMVPHWQCHLRIDRPQRSATEHRNQMLAHWKSVDADVKPPPVSRLSLDIGKLHPCCI